MSTITFQGKTMHLEGTFPAVGSSAPAFELPDSDMVMRSLSDYRGGVLVLLTVPSLDTPVCDLEVRHFNREAAGLSDRVRIVAVSRDLPFAQARWCAAAEIGSVSTLSDYRNGDFGRAYGVYISELALLARAVFVINADSMITYAQLVPELTEPPAYDEVLQAVKKEIQGM